MQQVPKRYLLIGNGKLARHLLYYLNHHAFDLTHWHKNSPHSLSSLIESSDIILLAISDDAIEEFYSKYLQGKNVVHFSGAKSIEGILGAHPLMMFGEDFLEISKYQEIPFITENKNLFKSYFNLPNPVFEIAKHNKAYYHALCVMAGNFTNFLWDEVKSSLKDDLAIESNVLAPYMAEVFKNIAKKEISHTGPIVRGDMQTINANLTALKNEHHKNIYKSFLSLKGIEL